MSSCRIPVWYAVVINAYNAPSVVTVEVESTDKRTKGFPKGLYIMQGLSPDAAIGLLRKE